MSEHPTLAELLPQGFQIVAATVADTGVTSIFLQQGPRAYRVDNPAEMDGTQFGAREMVYALHDQ